MDLVDHPGLSPLEVVRRAAQLQATARYRQVLRERAASNERAIDWYRTQRIRLGTPRGEA